MFYTCVIVKTDNFLKVQGDPNKVSIWEEEDEKMEEKVNAESYENNVEHGTPWLMKCILCGGQVLWDFRDRVCVLLGLAAITGKTLVVPAAPCQKPGLTVNHTNPQRKLFTFSFSAFKTFSGENVLWTVCE